MACGVLMLLASGSVRYARAWQNELTLWQWAADHAPLKPRPHINFALALMERRRFAEAERELLYVKALTDDISIALSTAERQSAKNAVERNRHALARLTEQ